MNRLPAILLLSGLLFCGVFTTTMASQVKQGQGFLAALREGQLLNIRENAGRYEITLMNDLKIGQKVIEVGADYLVIEDFSGVTETRIHVTSIKSIVKLKGFR